MSQHADEAGSPSAADRIADMLRERILEGALLPGSPLREISLAAELKISRNTLREGLRRLVAEGLVVQVPNKGAAVRTLTRSDVRDIYRARRALEVQAATESATADDDRFADMEAAVIASERAEQARAWRAAATASLRFHQALVAVLGSRRVDDFFRSLLAQLRLAWAASGDDEAFQRTWAGRDRELYELLRTGRRAQCVGALLVYLEDSERQVLDGVRATRVG
ncbi:GntR family transcriptional regulator [Spongiactinospora sp. 9N601]|uniref:GntR family transcriptional regulator n=1 Tax=Spongiactinospora sp. 9N601 TaxID=3375149 RepID=UPI00379BC71D